jgi:hypothetical protein
MGKLFNYWILNLIILELDLITDEKLRLNSFFL